MLTPLCLAPWLVLSSCATPVASPEDAFVSVSPIPAPSSANRSGLDGSVLDADGNQGSARIELTLDPTLAGAAGAFYDVSLDGTSKVIGQLGIEPGANDGSAVVNLPAGSGYVLTITATLGTGATTCMNATPFAVTSSVTVVIPITLQCDDPTSVPLADSSVGASGTRSDAAPDAGRDVLRDAAWSENASPPDVAAAHPATDLSRDAQASNDSGEVASDAGTAREDAGESCEVCSQRSCATAGGVDRLRDCYQAPGLVDAGPASGALRATTCAALMNCVHFSGCGATRWLDCYCGGGESELSCSHETALGPCPAQIEAAGESTDVHELFHSDGQKATVLSAASELLACEETFCAKSCIAPRP